MHGFEGAGLGEQSPAQPSPATAKLREGFTTAATAVTRLYWQADHSKFVAAANAVSCMHRQAEQEVVKAQARG